MQTAVSPTTPKTDNTDRLLTTPEAAHIVGLAVATLEIMRWQGRGPKFVRIGRAVRYPASEVRVFMESLTRHASTTAADQQAA